jgi:hypothetical protein
MLTVPRYRPQQENSQGERNEQGLGIEIGF